MRRIMNDATIKACPNMERAHFMNKSFLMVCSLIIVSTIFIITSFKLILDVCVSSRYLLFLYFLLKHCILAVICMCPCIEPITFFLILQLSFLIWSMKLLGSCAYIFHEFKGCFNLF